MHFAVGMGKDLASQYIRIIVTCNRVKQMEPIGSGLYAGSYGRGSGSGSQTW
jgi:hypothetical protein